MVRVRIPKISTMRNFIARDEVLDVPHKEDEVDGGASASCANSVKLVFHKVKSDFRLR